MRGANRAPNENKNVCAYARAHVRSRSRVTTRKNKPSYITKANSTPQIHNNVTHFTRTRTQIPVNTRNSQTENISGESNVTYITRALSIPRSPAWARHPHPLADSRTSPTRGHVHTITLPPCSTRPGPLLSGRTVHGCRVVACYAACMSCRVATRAPPVGGTVRGVLASVLLHGPDRGS